uniref:Uncharacterized protein n=1 Tax=Arundo donax TaxID=35708 RepID=A0A0A8ZH07_ARUDO
MLSTSLPATVAPGHRDLGRDMEGLDFA